MFLSWLKINEQTPLSKPNLWIKIYGTIAKKTVDNISIFSKSNVNTEFIFVSDLLNIDRTFINFDELKHIILKTIFSIEYASLKTEFTPYTRYTLTIPTKHNSVWTNYPLSYSIVY